MTYWHGLITSPQSATATNFPLAYQFARCFVAAETNHRRPDDLSPGANLETDVVGDSRGLRVPRQIG